MAYPVSPGTSPGPARVQPGVVNIAVNLLYFAAALQVISAILQVLRYGPTKDGTAKAFEGNASANTVSTASAVAVIIAAAFAVVFAVVLVVLARLDARGNNVARIITWVFGGIVLCCVGLGAASGAATNSLTNGTSTAGGPSAQQIQDAVNAELPSWLTPTSLAIGVIFVLAVLVALILLALPASNGYFSRRQPEQQWEPPLPPPASPA